MKSVKVSILLPDYSSRSSLEECVRAVAEQTFTDWELIISDNYSGDGTGNYLQACADKDSRIKILQESRGAGLFARRNSCISVAKGEYLCILTADGSILSEFLEIMADTLDRNSDCDIAHCKLKIIDETGDRHPALSWNKLHSTAYFGDMIDKKHIRFTPHDGLLHCGVGNVYTSITQLLIRRSLFDMVGLFLIGRGPNADFEWGMRASLVANIFHIPECLTVRRIPRNQAAGQVFLQTPKHYAQLLEMMEHAFSEVRKIKPDLLTEIDLKELKYLYTKNKFRFEYYEKNTRVGRYKTALKWLFMNPGLFFDCFRSVKSRKEPFMPKAEAIDFSRQMLKKYGFEKNLAQISDWSLGNPDKISSGLNTEHPPILIYQMSKVGSKTVYYSLKEHPVPNLLFHVHQLTYDYIYTFLENIEQRIKRISSQEADSGIKISRIVYNKNLREMLNHDLELRRKFDKYSKDFNWKIITLVRDPIARMFSDFYFSIQTKHPEATDIHGDIILEKSIDIFKNILKRFDEARDWASRWFDVEFKKVLGVDVYDYPFDHERGYRIIKPGNIEILIIKMEELDHCFFSAMSDFLGIKKIKLLRKNISAEKGYADVYKKAKKSIRIEKAVCEKIYATKYARHFCSEEERDNFTWKWSRDR
jgi:glycosyltransferase involved in cell wall biosynthesis